MEFLQPLVRQQLLKTWSDKEIKIGDRWHERIGAQLEASRAVVLLISPAFLASDYIATSELPVLLKNAADGGLTVLPIIISPCLYEEAIFKYPDPALGPNVLKLSSLQSANPPSRALIEMPEGEQNRVLLQVARSLQQMALPSGEKGGGGTGLQNTGLSGTPSTPASASAQTAQELYNLGLRSLRDQNYDAALDSLNQAITLDPQMAYAFYNRGLTYFFKRDDNRALADFSKSLELGFSTSMLFRNRANAYSRRGNVAEALADYERAITLEPENPLAYLNRGEVYENTLQKKLAIADYRKVLRLQAEPELKQLARERLLALGAKPR